MPVPAGQDGVINHTANGSTTVFAYDFLIINEDQLTVLFDGVVQSSGFTIDGVRNSSGGNVTFTTAPTDQVDVELRRRIPIGRTDFDYQTSGDLPANTLDDDIDSIWMALQQMVDAYDNDGKRIRNVADPVSAQDAATKNYVDTALNGGGHSSGSFTPTWSGFSTDPTGSIEWDKITYPDGAEFVLLTVPVALSGTSDAVDMSISGIPTEIRPSASRILQLELKDNGNNVAGRVNINSVGVMNFGLYNVSGSLIQNDPNSFTASGDKGINRVSVYYKL